MLVIPYKRVNGRLLYCVFKTREGYWQFIAGGGEGRACPVPENSKWNRACPVPERSEWYRETPLRAARRETWEESGIRSGRMTRLESMATIPKYHFSEHRDKKGFYVVPEYAFALEVGRHEKVVLSEEHVACAWVSYAQAVKRLEFDSNKNALWELKERLR